MNNTCLECGSVGCNLMNPDGSIICNNCDSFHIGTSVEWLLLKNNKALKEEIDEIKKRLELCENG